MTSFETARLSCRSLTASEYQIFEQGQEPTWEDFTNQHRHLLDGASPLPHRIPRVKANTDFAEIGLVLAIEKDSRILIGSAGFHDFPDANGMIEIGFGLVPEWQGHGFGQELLHGMWAMILKNPDVKVLRYTVSPQNEPSLHIIKKLKFNLVGEQIDDEDGLELIYEMGRDKYLSVVEYRSGDERI